VFAMEPASRSLSSSPAKSHGRYFGLDIARASAITMVLIVHGITVAGLPLFGEMFTGVDLFFVLSGFLVGRIYFVGTAREQFAVTDFWRARWLRTIPPYFAMLAGFWLCARPLPAYYWLFAQNYIGIVDFVPSWSLCVEEHFYLALPILGFAITRMFGRSSFVYLLPIAFFIPLGLRAATLWATGTMPTDWQYWSQFHCEGLVLGVWLAYLNVDRAQLFIWIRKPALWLTPLAPLMLAFLPLWKERPLSVNITLFTLYAIGYGAWVRALYDVGDWGKTTVGTIAQNSIRGLALFSYSLYLTHTNIAISTRLHIEQMHRGVAKTLFVLGVELIGGAAFYLACERPAIAIRDWLRARRFQKTSGENRDRA
jgi:peptidoglycan/LPS O-acetylase OafA/YrhL